MHAQDCYQVNQAHNKATRLVLLNKDDRADLNKLDQTKLSSLGFQYNLGDMAILTNENGDLDKIYISTEQNQEDKAIAIAVTNLPPGCYYFSHPLSHEASVMWALAQYRFDEFKSDKEPKRVLLIEQAHLQAILAEVEAIYLVRDLINLPANVLNPQYMTDVVRELAAQHQAQFEQVVGDELLSEGYPAIHAVGRAASHAPRLLSLTWGQPSHPRVTLIGKGVCFDSGGLDLKPANAMRLMKKDMGGAAQVIGLAKWLMAEQLPIRLTVLIPCVENAVSGNAFRPGDVITMRNGLTVEVDNTDAEGRLILADAISKACEDKPELMVDFATLTGAARVAVGTEISAMFTNDDAFAAELVNMGEKTQDTIWRMPLYPAYESLLKSNVADMVNSSDTPYAGAITAALFLQRFVAAECTWAHFDIMAWNTSRRPGKPEGGEAMGIRALKQWLHNKYS